MTGKIGRQDQLKRLLDMMPCKCEQRGETCETCNRIVTNFLADRELRAIFFKNAPQPIKAQSVK